MPDSQCAWQRASTIAAGLLNLRRKSKAFWQEQALGFQAWDESRHSLRSTMAVSAGNLGFLVGIEEAGRSTLCYGERSVFPALGSVTPLRALSGPDGAGDGTRVGTWPLARHSGAMEDTNPFSRFVHRMAVELEADVDRLRRVVGAGGRDRHVRLLAFAGYRNATELRAMGRIVHYAEPLNDKGDTFSNIRAMWSIYNSHEVAGVPVVCEVHGTEHASACDEEGYFSFAVPVSASLPPSTRWEPVTLTTPGWQMQEASVEVPILAPGTDDHWGIISDIDDTIIETGATDFLKNWRRVLLERPQDRLAVPGASSLYGTIAVDHASPTRPFFYVSSSPWNLYGFLTEFMELNRIPHGPMFLKDLGLDASKFIHTGHERHKLAAIRSILEFYPGRKFLLMGDNGQKDVEIYAEAVRSFPERVAAVFIRDVTGTCTSGAKAELIAEMARAGVATYCAEDLSGGVAILKSLGLERIIEVAKAAGQQSDSVT